MTDQHSTIESHPLQGQTYPPSDAFRAQANVTDSSVYWRAAQDPEAYWAEQARSLTWTQPFTEVLDWSNPPFARWFGDGKLNVAANCLDRHVAAGLGDRVAFHFEGEPGDTRTITYAELTYEVKRAANMLASLGIGQGDRVAIYMPLIPETIISMLAVARVGAIHSVVFGGFSADSLRSRIDDAEAKLVITADGGFRKGRVSPLKPTVDDALSADTGAELSVEHVLVVQRGENEIDFVEGRDLWWHEEIQAYDGEHTAEGFDAENPLFILYTSGTTGKPKGIVHTSGGYLTQTSTTHRNVFDLKPETDVFWCTADVGWITGHSYVVYGPLANGATQVIYEGTPETPNWGRWWDIVQKYGVTIFYTAPTAIRACMKVGRQVPAEYDLSSIRLLGSVGEPINPEAWRWFREVIGGSEAPIMDTWWQTETGAHMISPPPRSHRAEARERTDRAAGHRSERGERGRRAGGAGSERPARRRAAVAEHAAHHLGRRPALHRHLLGQVRRQVLRGRRRAARRRRRHLVPRSRRRRDERVRPPTLHDGDRVGTGRAPRRRRVGGRRCG